MRKATARQIGRHKLSGISSDQKFNHLIQKLGQSDETLFVAIWFCSFWKYCQVLIV
jgi:hypothetical protein